MRFYFTKNGHIVSVEELFGLKEAEATKDAHDVYSERQDFYDGYEVWNLARFLSKYPAAGDGPVMAARWSIVPGGQVTPDARSQRTGNSNSDR
jgi:hypothetical protein